MPDDSPIDEGLEQQGQDPGGDLHQSGPQGPQNGSGGAIAPNPEVVEGIVQKSLEPVAEAIQALAQEVQQIKQAGAGQNAGDSLQGQQSSAQEGDPFSELATDPRGFVAKLAEEQTKRVLDEWAKQNLAPVMSLMLTEQSQKVEAEARESVDREFGEGTYDEMVKPELDKLLAGQDPRSRGFATIVNRAIDQIIGQNREKFFERRKSAEEQRKRDPEPLMSGGIRGLRGRSEEEELKPIVRKWVEERNRVVGDNYSPDQLLQARKIGNTLGEWRAALEKQQRRGK